MVKKKVIKKVANTLKGTRKKVAKKATRKKPVKKKTNVMKVTSVKGISKKSVKGLRARKVGYNKRKLNVVLGNLSFFVILFVVSTILYSISTTEFYLSLFFMLSLIMGVFSVAFLIVFLIFMFLKFLNR